MAALRRHLYGSLRSLWRGWVGVTAASSVARRWWRSPEAGWRAGRAFVAAGAGPGGRTWPVHHRGPARSNQMGGWARRVLSRAASKPVPQSAPGAGRRLWPRCQRSDWPALPACGHLVHRWRRDGGRPARPCPRSRWRLWSGVEVVRLLPGCPGRRRKPWNAPARRGRRTVLSWCVVDRRPRACDCWTFESVLSAVEDGQRRGRPRSGRGCAPSPPPVASTAGSGRRPVWSAEPLVAAGVWDCRIGIADGIFAAEHAARRAAPQDCRGWSRPVVCRLPGRQPVAVLDDAELVSLLRRLGLRSVADFAALPGATYSPLRRRRRLVASAGPGPGVRRPPPAGRP